LTRTSPLSAQDLHEQHPLGVVAAMLVAANIPDRGPAGAVYVAPEIRR
jgi:hypothetical protein